MCSGELSCCIKLLLCSWWMLQQGDIKVKQFRRKSFHLITCRSIFTLWTISGSPRVLSDSFQILTFLFCLDCNCILPQLISKQKAGRMKTTSSFLHSNNASDWQTVNLSAFGQGQQLFSQHANGGRKQEREFKRKE